MAKYPNIPGVNMNVIDGQLMLNAASNSPRLLIIGDVPAGYDAPEEPVLVQSEEQLKQNFGGFFYGGKVNPIALEWKAAQDSGTNFTYLMALKGGTPKEKYVNLHNQLFGYMSDFGVEHLILTGLNADTNITGLQASDYLLPEEQEAFPAVNGVVKMGHVSKGMGRISVASFPLIVKLGDNDTFKIKKVVGNTEVVITLAAKTYTDPSDLFDEVKAKIKASPDFANFPINNDNDIFTMVSTFAVQFLPGEKNDIIKALKMTNVLSVYSQNEDGKDVVGNPAHLISAFAEAQSMQFNNTIAYIGVTPPVGTSLKDLQTFVKGLVQRDNSVSKYVQVVAGPNTGITVPGSLRPQWTTGVTHYASLVSGLAPQIASTNQELKAVDRLQFVLSLAQHNALIGNKYVTYRIKNNAIVVSDGITTAPDLQIGEDTVTSDFIRLSTLRSTNYMIKAIRDTCEPFIGAPNEFSIYNAMNAAIKSTISDAISRGIIQDAKYGITLGETFDTSEIKLKIYPQFELRIIEVTLGLSNPDNFASGV